MREGAPIAYTVLERGVPVIASDGQTVGSVDHVVAAPEQDIFHGIVFRSGGGRHFVGADQVASLHEMGVDLKIDSVAAAALPPPGGGAPVFTEDPSAPGGWHHWVRRLTGRSDWQRER
jgi:hypothetical protein